MGRKEDHGKRGESSRNTGGAKTPGKAGEEHGPFDEGKKFREAKHREAGGKD